MYMVFQHLLFIYLNLYHTKAHIQYHEYIIIYIIFTIYQCFWPLKTNVEVLMQPVHTSRYICVKSQTVSVVHISVYLIFFNSSICWNPKSKIKNLIYSVKLLQIHKYDANLKLKLMKKLRTKQHILIFWIYLDKKFVFYHHYTKHYIHNITASSKIYACKLKSEELQLSSLLLRIWDFISWL